MTQVIFWIELAAGRVLKMGCVAPPIMSGFIGMAHSLLQNFQDMDKIDKTQFPFPYNQIVKILILIWVNIFPFFIVRDAGHYSHWISGLVALGYYGLDLVAEILESPFGNDPNDIFLRGFGAELMEDMDMIYNNRTVTLNAVFKEGPLHFKQLLEGRFAGVKSSPSGGLNHISEISRSITTNFSRGGRWPFSTSDDDIKKQGSSNSTGSAGSKGSSSPPTSQMNL